MQSVFSQRTILGLIGVGLVSLPGLCAAQDASPPDEGPRPSQSRTQVVQIGELAPDETAQPPVQPPVQTIWTDQVSDGHKRADITESAVGPAPDESGLATDQVSPGEAVNQPVPQLSTAEMSRLLAQLPEADRQIVLDAVEGADICADPPDIEAVIAFCERRLETRSEEFAGTRAPVLSAEERLLGSGLEDEPALSLESAVDRLARNGGRADDPQSQAIASVALTASLTPTPQAEEPGAGTGGEIAPETQALVDAIVQQVGNGGGL
ncbi:MAG: hypothetical protein QNI87_12965 [Erythrobacter sp.]|uniref:hypothetical protein n=1 Tax=Erythrobacter sp. TaxID=1042 RepID=UPI00262B52B9|nr:hypothetical protein [Erythrobacter sp.]MDJ0979430.1 hypothetical protein [Erythrobacter sp.]